MGEGGQGEKEREKKGEEKGKEGGLGLVLWLTAAALRHMLFDFFSNIDTKFKLEMSRCVAGSNRRHLSFQTM